MKLFIKLLFAIGIYYVAFRIGSHVGNTFVCGWEAAFIGAIVVGLNSRLIGKDDE